MDVRDRILLMLGFIGFGILILTVILTTEPSICQSRQGYRWCIASAPPTEPKDDPTLKGP